jgi:hypothetical protein
VTDEDDCGHGWRPGERTRAGHLACPHCRRSQHAAVERLVRIRPPLADWQALAAGDTDD